MAREFVVRIRRTDMTGIDNVHIRAATRGEAEAFVGRMYGPRLVKIVRPKKRQRCVPLERNPFYDNVEWRRA